MRELVLADRDAVSAVDNDVGCLKHGVAEKAVGGEVFLIDLKLLLLIGWIPFEPGQRGDHPEQKIEFRMFLDVGLDDIVNSSGPGRHSTSREPSPRYFCGFLPAWHSRL